MSKLVMCCTTVAVTFSMGCIAVAPGDERGDGPTGTVAAAAAAEPPNGSTAHDWMGKRWPSGVVPYVIDTNGTFDLGPTGCVDEFGTPTRPPMTAGQLAEISGAIAEIEALSPVRFKKFAASSPPSGPFILYLSHTIDGGETDTRGVRLDGKPTCVRLSPSSGTPKAAQATALHETLHALGFAHEQQRSDRNGFVFFDSTCEASAGSQPKIFDIETSLLLTPYDLHSIMQYNSYSGWAENSTWCPQQPAGQVTANPTLTTITPPECLAWSQSANFQHVAPPASCLIDQPLQLSVHDVNALGRMYEQALGVNNGGDDFGAALAAGDFDSDGYQDLAVGAPGNDRVYLWKGTAGSTQGSLGRLVAWKVLKPADYITAGSKISTGGFGTSLAAGDFDGDGNTDLAVGAPKASGGITDDAGSVAIYRSWPVDSLTTRRVPQFWVAFSESALGGAGAAGDYYGQALAAGDFDHDGTDDLAIGAPHKTVGGKSSGAVLVGQLNRINVPFKRLTPADVSGGSNVDGARFGHVLAAANVNRDVDLFDDLVVGSPEDASTPAGAGSAYVFKGTATGLTGKQRMTPADPVSGMYFGYSLAIGDFHGTTTPAGHRTLDIAIGATRRKAFRPRVGGFDTINDAGGVYVFSTPSTSIAFSQSLAMQPADIVTSGHFGKVLAFSTNTAPTGDTLFVGLPDIGAGEVEAINYASGVPSATMLRPPTALATGDLFGSALVAGNYRPNSTGAPGNRELVVGASSLGGAGAYFVDDGEAAPSMMTWNRFQQDTVIHE